MSTTVTYKGQNLTTVENQTRTLTTAGKYLEDDITLTDVTQGGGGETRKLVDSSYAGVYGSCVWVDGNGDAHTGFLMDEEYPYIVPQVGSIVSFCNEMVPLPTNQYLNFLRTQTMRDGPSTVFYGAAVVL